jgi:membrane protein YdbS with pleckstrin-like domain
MNQPDSSDDDRPSARRRSTHVPYAERTLADDERLLGHGRFHPLQWAGLLVLLITTGWLLIPLYWLVPAIVRKATMELSLTNRRLILKRGWFTRSVDETPLSAIESVHVQQGVLDRLLGIGRITIHGAGGGAVATPAIANVVRFHQAIENALPR